MRLFPIYIKAKLWDIGKVTRIGKTRKTHTISIHKHQAQNKTVLFSECDVMWTGSSVAKTHRITLFQSQKIQNTRRRIPEDSNLHT